MPEFGWVPPREGYERARASVERGLALNPNSAQLHSVMAVIHAIYDWDWSGAVTEAQRALAIDRRHPQVLVDVGQVYFGLGNWDEAGRLLSAAVAVDPLSAPAHLMLAYDRLATRRLVEAEAESRRVLQISPTFTGARTLLGTVLLEAGRLDEALARSRMSPAIFALLILLSCITEWAASQNRTRAASRNTPKNAFRRRRLRYYNSHAYRNEINRHSQWLHERPPTRSRLYQIRAIQPSRLFEPIRATLRF